LGVFTVNAGGSATSWYFNLLAEGHVEGRQPNTGSRAYYYTDHLGSTRAVVQGATPVESHDYDPWGLEMPGRGLGSGTKEAFSGKEQDAESGLDYFGARYYLAAIGRWGAVDPVAEDMLEWSPYNYVSDNPASEIDPDGRQGERALQMFERIRSVPPEHLAAYDRGVLRAAGGTVVSAPLLGLTVLLGPAYAQLYAEAAVRGIVDLGNRMQSSDPIVSNEAAGEFAFGVTSAIVGGILGSGAVANASRANVAQRGLTVFRRGTFADVTKDWPGSNILGREWSSDNPLTTPNFEQVHGLMAENSGRPDWVVQGQVRGPYTIRPSPASPNDPANVGGAKEVVPKNPRTVWLEWFHMPD
jgi:RHS repeat-associated protein